MTKLKYFAVRFPTNGASSSCRVVYQHEKATQALVVPFIASNGTTIQRSENGEPYITAKNGQVVIGLRNPGAVPSDHSIEFGGAKTQFRSEFTARLAANKARSAMREFRAHLQEETL